jgi:uncharacterized protein
VPITSEPWPEGAPAWVDLMASDVDRSKQFYADLFGWEYEEGSEEFGFYSTARLDGHAVAGLGPTQGPESPPSAWTTYLASEDLDATLAKITAAGGQVFMPAMGIGTFGSMAVVADPTGTVFGLWQSGTHTGFDLYGEPGAVIWNEGMVGDLEAGRRFYGEVFDYSFEPVEEGTPYDTITLHGRQVAGLGSIDLAGPGIPPHWRTYFAAADVPAACARVSELGGDIVAEPWDTPFGTMAAVSGPDHEVFLLNGRAEPASGG